MSLSPYQQVYDLSYRASHFWLLQNMIDKSQLPFIFLLFPQTAWPNNMNCLQLSFVLWPLWPFDDINLDVAQIAKYSLASDSIWQDLHGLTFL